MTAASRKRAPGYPPRLRGGESEMRARRSLERIVRRKLKQGRPGRPSNAPRPTFDWEMVVGASQRKNFRQYETRRARDREWPQ